MINVLQGTLFISANRKLQTESYKQKLIWWWYLVVVVLVGLFPKKR